MSTANNGKWAELLGEFQEIIKDFPEPKKVKEQLLALIEKAKTSNELTFRQVDGIRDRVNNYLNGDYGKTKLGIKMQGGVIMTTIEIVSMTKKYVTVTISGIITQIAKPTKVKGYTEGILECFYPDHEGMTDRQIDDWTKENNKRMTAICKFLNENNL